MLCDEVLCSATSKYSVDEVQVKGPQCQSRGLSASLSLQSTSSSIKGTTLLVGALLLFENVIFGNIKAD